MRKMKKVLGLVLACIMALGNISFAGAVNSPLDSVDASRYDYFIIENGSLRKATPNEVAERLVSLPEGVESNTNIVPNGTWSDIWEFRDYKYLMEGNVEKFATPVSAWSKVDDSGTGSFSVQVSKSFGREYSVSLSAEAQNAIAGELGASWSVTVSQGVTQTLPCRKNSTARLVYIPYYKVYEGALDHRKWNYSLISSQMVTVYQPTTYVDGLYAVEYK